MANKYSYLEVTADHKRNDNTRTRHMEQHRLPPTGTPEGAAVAADTVAVNANPVPTHLVDCCVDGDEPELLEKHKYHRDGHQQCVHSGHETQ